MIAIFDSGYGGLTVLKPIIDLLPEYDYLYLGDNARMPYGNHSAENIKIFSEQAVECLFKHGATLIIFACNTASSVALREIQQKYLKSAKKGIKKILGVLIPVAEEAAKLAANKRIGVVGTRATINSRAYEREIHKINPKIKIYSKACPLIVPLIEENYQKKPQAISILKNYLRELKCCNLDALILGCTHYPLMEANFKKIMGKKVKILNSGIIAAQSLKDYLKRHSEIEKRLPKNRKREFLTTDDPLQFKQFIEQHFKMKIKTPQKIELF